MIKTYRPTSAGIRFRKTLVREVEKVLPEKALRKVKKGHVGRNNGKISSRHRQQGHRKHFRLIDFKRDKREIQAKVASIQHAPPRGPYLALSAYYDAKKPYILAAEGLKKGMVVSAGESVEPAVPPL